MASFAASVVGIALLLVAVAASAEQGAPAPADRGPKFAIPTTRDRIGRIIAPVTLNGQGPYRFVVDTGANHSTVSSALAAALRLTPAANVMLHGVTGSAEVAAVRVERMRAGWLILEDQLLPLVDSPMMAGADGILGVAGWSRERISVDFRHDVITIEASPGYRAGSEVLVHALPIAGGLLAISARISGIRVKAIIDTGAERTIGNLNLREALRKQRGSSRKFSSSPVYGATDDVASAEAGRAPQIDLGVARIVGVQMFYSDLHVFDVWHLRDEPAVLIGMDVLGTLDWLVIDYRMQELRFGV